MVGVVTPVYAELDPQKKNPEWANSVITILRRDWRRISNVNRALEDRSILYSVQPLPKVRDSFDDEEFKKCTTFSPLPILEPMVNAVVEEITRNPPKADLKALDPSAVIEKKQDIELLKNRSILENDRTELHSMVGLPDYKMGYDNFAGNVEEFDKLGLDSDDPEDVTFYEANLQKLKAESAGQSVINAVFRNSRFDKELSRKLVKDVMALKTVVLQKYVDQITGEIKDRYVDPSTFYGIFGQTNSGRDDICRGYQDTRTVMEWLQMVGNEFDFDRDWRFLLWGINYCNVQRFTGFTRNGVQFDCCGDGNWSNKMGLDDIAEPKLLDWSQAYMYKVYVGYIEWRSPEASITFLKNRKNEAFIDTVPYSYLLSEKKIKEGYEKESRYQMPWYKSYFIATTSVSQWVWGFGKVYMQRTEGANDEYSNGTICYYQEEGLSAVEIAKPYLEVANFTFYRMLWVIYKAKPDPDEFVFDELLQLAGTVQRQFPQNGTSSVNSPGLDDILTKLIKQQRAKHIRLRTYPRIDGRAVQQIHPIEQKGRGGLDPIAMSMQAVCQWAEANIASKIGINPIRLGANPPSRESTESEQATVDYSMATTGYIYRMIQYIKEHSAICALSFAQDIIKYKESLPWKWLKTIVGEEAFSDLKILEKFAFHRCGLFISDDNTAISKKEVKDAATMALGQKEISFDQWFMITQSEDYKRAALLLGRYKEKAAKAAEQAELEKLKVADQYDEKKHKREMAKLAFERETLYNVHRIDAQSFVASAQVNTNGRIQAQELKDAAAIQQQIVKKDNAIEEKKEEANLQQQQPLQ